VIAVLDWEMSTIGDPLTDVAMLCVYQHPAFDHVVGEPAASTSPRWPKPAQIAQAYAQHSGRDLADFDAYLALAHLKLAVIAEGIAARHRAGAGHGAGFETAGAAVPDLLAAGLAVLRGAGS
jgi:aminoglycoside phosphotransferase (APT) family kinase protein